MFFSITQINCRKQSFEKKNKQKAFTSCSKLIQDYSEEVLKQLLKN